MAWMVCVNGSPRRVSRTRILIDAIAEAIGERIDFDRQHVSLADDGHHILSGLTRKALSPSGESICQAIEAADLLVFASPVYRASYTGLVKHLFDLVDRDRMRGKMAVLGATGGTPLHGLVVDHQFRPLMSFFGIHTVATAPYALEEDFSERGIASPFLRQRIDQAAREVARLFDARSHLTKEATTNLSTPACAVAV